MSVRALIVDDEPPGRDRIRMLLDAHPRIEIIGESSDGRGAVDGIVALRPDLVFLDIQMPEMDGFDVLEAVGRDALPAVIFVTAFDEYAIRAFDVNAVDYLLKPVDPARLTVALQRLFDRLDGHGHGAMEARVAALLDAIALRKHAARLVVRDERGAFFLATESIDWIEAAGNYARVHAGADTHLLRETLRQLETKLDPERFVRVNRSAIVNIERVERVEPWYRGEYVVLLRDGTRLTSSRAYGESFRALLE